MEILCPECDRPFAASEMNVAKDVAVCPECDEAYALSELVADQKVAVEEFDLGQPPPGVSFERVSAGWRLTTTTRTWESLFLVPFAVFWCGVGFPALYSYIASGNYDWNQTVGAVLYSLAAPVVIYLAMTTTIGRLAVSVERGEGKVVAGVGLFRWTRRFDWNSISKVEEEHVAWGDSRLAVILIREEKRCQRRFVFGSMLRDQRRRYLVQTLRQLLAARDR